MSASTTITVHKLARVLRDAANCAGRNGLATIDKDWLLASADTLTATPVAWRWRWGKLGSNTAWHLSLEKPGPFPEDGYEVEPLYALDASLDATPEGLAAAVEAA